MDFLDGKQFGKYKALFKIGSGMYSVVYHGCNTSTGEAVAMKFIQRKTLNNHKYLLCFEKELRILPHLSHESIVKLYDTIYTSDFIIIVMEDLRGGTLTMFKETALIEIREQTCIRWGKEILEGINYLHNKKISHHDIKPDNIGFDDHMKAKIFDFGLCEECVLEHSIEKCHNTCGTPFFFAPELLTSPEYDGRKSDIWSFGVTFHYLITGRLPFVDVSYKEFIKKCSDIKSILKIVCEGQLREIVEAALNPDPSLRPTAEELLKLEVFEKAEKLAYIPTFNDAPKIRTSKTTKNITHMINKPRRPIIVAPNSIRMSIAESRTSSRLIGLIGRY